MVILNVPFNEKDKAKLLGALWNANIKKWYVPHGMDSGKFSNWLTDKDESCLLPSRKNNDGLFVDLIPQTAWFSNLRSELTTDEWDVVRKLTYRTANYCCEVCGGKGPNHPVECHERFTYDTKTKVQRLVSTIALCPDCHETTHFGLASVRGRDQEARQHLMVVNDWNSAQADQHINKAMDDWQDRNKIKWSLDARWLLSFVQLSSETQKKDC